MTEKSEIRTAEPVESDSDLEVLKPSFLQRPRAEFIIKEEEKMLFT